LDNVIWPRALRLRRSRETDDESTACSIRRVNRRRGADDVDGLRAHPRRVDDLYRAVVLRALAILIRDLGQRAYVERVVGCHAARASCWAEGRPCDLIPGSEVGGEVELRVGDWIETGPGVVRCGLLNGTGACYPSYCAATVLGVGVVVSLDWRGIRKPVATELRASRVVVICMVEG
jgi:hypothetical protein